eukprot:TRINITY_DN79563_c0_g1_i1.p2 TRINITY_DN79563_c0_g1~~TRINITY_DN79563_c0_g1_i1.p2  ORF type:complete len:138 (+),score=28.74 TRINITY_DN79563_c0_g1_i1:82-495(+)
MPALLRIVVFVLLSCHCISSLQQDECESDDDSAMLQVQKHEKLEKHENAAQSKSEESTWTAVGPIEFRKRTQRRAIAHRHRVFACGDNSNGQLGQGLNATQLTNSSKPLLVKGLERYTIVEVDAADQAEPLTTSSLD